jgi:hypothetical protein
MNWRSFDDAINGALKTLPRVGVKLDPFFGWRGRFGCLLPGYRL